MTRMGDQICMQGDQLTRTMRCSMFTGTALGGKILEVSQNQYRNLIVFATAAYLASFVSLVWAKFVCCGRERIWSKM
jgi:hypothetical protein